MSLYISIKRRRVGNGEKSNFSLHDVLICRFSFILQPVADQDFSEGVARLYFGASLSPRRIFSWRVHPLKVAVKFSLSCTISLQQKCHFNYLIEYTRRYQRF